MRPHRFLVLALAAAGPCWAAQMSISGRVVMEDGSPPPGFVRIERICGGQRFVETETDPKGRFSFSVIGGQESTTIDATTSRPGVGGGIRASGARGMYDFGGCGVRAILAGYESLPHVLGVRSVFDSPDIGVIVLHPIEKLGSATISVTSLTAPTEAKKAYDRALKELAQPNPNLKKATRNLEKAVAAYQSYAAAWTLLGRVRQQSGDQAGAHEAFRTALKADASYVPSYLPLLRLHMAEGRWPNVAKMAEQAVRLDPRLTEARFSHSIACLYLDRLDDALESALAVQGSDQAAAFPQTHHVAGLIYADRKDFAAAAREFQAFVELQPKTQLAQTLRKQLGVWKTEGLIPAK